MPLLGLGLGAPVVWTFLETGLVPRLPTAVLATGLVLLSSLSLVCGLVLDSVARGRKEAKRGSPALCLVCFRSGGNEDALPEEVKASTAVHGALDRLHTISG